MKTRTRILLWLLLGLLTFIIIVLVLPIPPAQAKRNATHARLAALQDAIRQFVSENGRQPTAPEATAIIKKVLGKDTTDPWGTPFTWTEIQGKVVMVSAGPDKSIGTADDLTDQ